MSGFLRSMTYYLSFLLLFYLIVTAKLCAESKQIRRFTFAKGVNCSCLFSTWLLGGT